MIPELVWATPAGWASAVLENPIALLVDHAHCELGAASTAQTLIARHPGLAGLVDRLAALASEEMRHFRRVHRVIRKLGGELMPIRANPYAVGMVKAIDRAAPDALADRLLVSALIERRSHERFELLARTPARAAVLSTVVSPSMLRDEINGLFTRLGPSEAGHAQIFVDLARELFPEVDVDSRLALWARFEARLIRELPFAPRIHSGPPPGRGSEVMREHVGVER